MKTFTEQEIKNIISIVIQETVEGYSEWIKTSNKYE